MGNGPCMGDIDCEMDQTFSGPVSDFRNSVGSGGAPKSAWNGREKSSVVSSKYEAIVEVGGITYYNEHFGAGDTNDRAEDKKSGERSLDIVGATERSEGASNTFRIKTVEYRRASRRRISSISLFERVSCSLVMLTEPVSSTATVFAGAIRPARKASLISKRRSSRSSRMLAVALRRRCARWDT